MVPGIHAVLRAGGLEKDGKYFTQEHRERGKAVHLATLMHDLGETSVLLPERWRPYYDAYLRFRTEVSCTWRKLEHPKVSRQLRYASIIDREGLVSGRSAVVEIKTGFPASFHGPQLAGADLLLSRVIGTRRRLAVYLRRDGTYQLREYEQAADYQRFTEALGVYWGVGNGSRRPDRGVVRPDGFTTNGV